MDRIARLDRIVRDWLDDPDTTIVCGRWTDGSVGELLPRGRARLSAAKHEGRFAGLRDLWIEGEEHHLHVDLGSFDRVVYAVVPSVCFGWRPSLELRFERASQPTGLAFATSAPYAVDRLRTPLAERYLRRLLHHRDEHPGLVAFAAQAAPQRTHANVTSVGEGGGAFVLGAPAFDPSTNTVLLPEAGVGLRRFAWSAGTLTEGSASAIGDALGLPARSVALLP